MRLEHAIKNVVTNQREENSVERKPLMSFAHAIRNVVNNVDEQRSSHTPGQKDGIQEHPLSKQTSDYEEKYFSNKDDGEGKDDREKFITGKKPEQKANVEDTEGHVNPTKKVSKAAPVAEELDSLNQQRVQELLEKYGPTQG